MDTVIQRSLWSVSYYYKNPTKHVDLHVVQSGHHYHVIKYNLFLCITVSMVTISETILLLFTETVL
jgi:hypothetical protein